MSYEDLQSIVTWHFNEQIVDNQHILDDLWTLTNVYAKSEEEHQKQTNWENHLREEFNKETDRARRYEDQANYKFATWKACQRTGTDICPQWINHLHITGDTINEPYELENIWEEIHRCLQRAEKIKTRNRRGKERWVQLLKEAISDDEQTARDNDTTVRTYTHAIL